MLDSSKFEEIGISKAYVSLKEISNFDPFLKDKSSNSFKNLFWIPFTVILVLNAINVDDSFKQKPSYELYVLDEKKNIIRFQLNNLNIINSEILKKLNESYIVEAAIQNFSSTLVFLDFADFY